MGKMPVSREKKILYRSLLGKKSGFCVKQAGHSWAWLENDPARTCPWVGRDTDGGLTGHVSHSLQAQPRARESSGHLTGCPAVTGHGESASQAFLASSMLLRHGTWEPQVTPGKLHGGPVLKVLTLQASPAAASRGCDEETSISQPSSPQPDLSCHCIYGQRLFPPPCLYSSLGPGLNFSHSSFHPVLSDSPLLPEVHQR